MLLGHIEELYMHAIDRLEVRARELAKESGLDPDSRIPKEGSVRGMPAWCGYRDAARAEQNLREATEAADQFVNLRPQELKYQNAPLTVFGEHDEATLKQMQNCMSIGNVVSGVICADGHLGYAQPVGGVIAYEKQISISGVGFDIGCFTGDTRIFTLDGQSPTLAEIVGQEVYVMSCTDRGTPIPSKALAKMTRKNAELVRVTLDNGRQIRCTPDQEFMLRNGSYMRADLLTPQQSLMPLYTSFDKDGYVQFRDSKSKRLLRLQRIVYAAGLGNKQPQTLTAKIDVHHLDENRTNKIVSVEHITDCEDVYCLSVFGLNENFALIDGVFVHNCGNGAIRLDIPYTAIENRVSDILDEVWKVISFGVGRTNDERVEHELFDDSEAWRTSDMATYRQKAVSQLGTVGSGNHYVDLMRDENDFVWVGVHFGSRGLGHTSATRYLKAAGGKDGMHVAPAIVDDDSELGIRYIAAMQLAGRYAHAGRDWVLERVHKIIGGNVTDAINNHHNSAWQENHNGRDLWVVRKGATPAFPGQRGFVGGSMGDDAVIIEGVDGPEARATLYSTIHGAGRLYGRKHAIRTFTRTEMEEWLQRRSVLLRGGGIDESPMAYRRLPEVLAHHAGSIKVLHTLRPFAVAMAGTGEYDPFRD